MGSCIGCCMVCRIDYCINIDAHTRHWHSRSASAAVIVAATVAGTVAASAAAIAATDAVAAAIAVQSAVACSRFASVMCDTAPAATAPSPAGPDTGGAWGGGSRAGRFAAVQRHWGCHCTGGER